MCFADKTPQSELALAAVQSSQLNRAYRTLLSPLDRAQYILSLHGVEESETEKLQDEEFIMQVMEARQEVEEASSPAEIDRIKEINKGGYLIIISLNSPLNFVPLDRIDGTIRELATHIGEKDWEAARKLTVQLKYWLGIENAAKEWAHA